jgi:hypothetical protein
MDTITILSVIIAGFIAYTILLLCGIRERDRLIKILRDQLSDAEAREINATCVARKYCQINRKLQCQLDAEKVFHATAIKLIPNRDKSGKFTKRGSTK